MNNLKEFHETNGNCLVPKDYPGLGVWVEEQRRQYTLCKRGKSSRMTGERAAELNAIGFCWGMQEVRWMERLRELTEYKEKFGSCMVPTRYDDNPKLGTWVHRQRRQYKMFQSHKPSHITRERISALEKLGFVWRVSNREKLRS